MKLIQGPYRISEAMQQEYSQWLRRGDIGRIAILINGCWNIGDWPTVEMTEATIVQHLVETEGYVRDRGAIRGPFTKYYRGAMPE